jgi:hypothetical protein
MWVNLKTIGDKLSKLIWELKVECTDPNVVGNPKKEKELIRQFDEFYKLLIRSFRMTRTYQIGLIKIDRKAWVEEKGEKKDGS